MDTEIGFFSFLLGQPWCSNHSNSCTLAFSPNSFPRNIIRRYFDVLLSLKVKGLKLGFPLPNTAEIHRCVILLFGSYLMCYEIKRNNSLSSPSARFPFFNDLIEWTVSSRRRFSPLEQIEKRWWEIKIVGHSRWCDNHFTLLFCNIFTDLWESASTVANFTLWPR